MESNNHSSMYVALQDLCTNNKEYFKNEEDENGLRLYQGFNALFEHVQVLIPVLQEFRDLAPKFDYNEHVKANGYRSFIFIADSFVVLCVKICKDICINRGSLFFKKSRYVKDVEISSQIFASLNSCFDLLKFLKSTSEPDNSLFLLDHVQIKESLNLIDKINLYCFFGRFIGFQYCDSIQPIVKSLSMMMAAFGSVFFGENNFLAWTSSCSSMIMDPEARSNQIVKISNYRTASVHFCKAFWNLSELELFKIVPKLFNTSGVNKLFTIPLEPLSCTLCDGSSIDIPIPKSIIANQTVSVRLISAKKRQGMDVEINKKETLEPVSKCLIFHLHGGGFVAQTSGSHQSYLKEWSSWIDCPIISVDYSLAPEAPYPRALEEVLYVYAWILQNASTIGTTGEKIIFAGDSAGGNLCLSLAMKCIELNIRKPDGLFLAYLPVIMSIVPTPARILCMLDPLMPFGFMISCIRAYTYGLLTKGSDFLVIDTCKDANNDDNCINLPITEENSAILQDIEYIHAEFEDIDNSDNKEDNFESSEEERVIFEITDNTEEEEITLPSKFKKATENFIKTVNKRVNKFKKAGNIILRNEKSFTNEFYQMKTVEDLIDEVPADIYLSPYLASDQIFKQLPPVSLLSVQLDPCLDDCVMLAKKLKRVGNEVTFDVLEGLPHGFLNLSLISKEAQDGSKLCAQRIKKLFDLDS